MFAPKFNEDAFLRYGYTELMAFCKLHDKVTFLAFGAIESMKGNQRTELTDTNGDLITDTDGTPIADANGLAMDAIGTGYGFGLDYDFSKRACLNYRHRFYKHEDKNQTKDIFHGHEATLEQRVFF